MDIPHSPFDEVLLESRDGKALYALINGDRGFLLFTRWPGDPGFTSRDPAYSGDPEAMIEYRLGNGQHDWHPAAWSLPVAEVRRALDRFSRTHERPADIVWHAD